MSRPRLCSCLALVAALGSTPLLAAQGLAVIEAQDAKPRASDPGTDDAFGTSVALDGNLAVVGAPFDDNQNGADAGAVYVFERTGSSWTQIAKLVATAGAAQEAFGVAVAMEGETIVAGAYAADAGKGAAYVFERCSGAWAQQAKLVHPAGVALDAFGKKVAIDGGTIVVGAPGDTACANDSGSAWVWVRVDNGTPADPCDDTWSLQTVSPLLPSNCQAGAIFGIAVAVDADRIAVGAMHEDSPQGNRGAAYVFERAGTVWTETARLLDPNGTTGDHLGSEVALDGETLLAAAFEDDAQPMNSGSAHVFVLQGGSWQYRQWLLPSDPDAEGRFGFAMGLVDDVALVSAWGADSGTGAAYLFRRGAGTWTLEQRVTACDAAVGDGFGAGIAFDGETALVGAPGDDDTTSSSGSVASFAISIGHFQRYGFGDGSATACPCGNASLGGYAQGCGNSTGRGGKLSVAGRDSLLADDFRLIACNLIPGNPGLLYSGPNRVNGGAGIPFGNGLRLVGGGIDRHGIRIPDADGRAIWGPGLGSTSNWSPGNTVHFQAWYRDPFHGACVDVFNLTNALTIVFQP